MEESSGREVKKVSSTSCCSALFLYIYIFCLILVVTSRSLLKVRKARNRRQEWSLMAYDKELRPDARVTPSPYQTSDGSMSPDR